MRLPALVLTGMLWAGTALAWPYENYRVPDSFDGYRVAETVPLKGGKVELLLDARITPANAEQVRAILLGRPASDTALQDSLDREDPRWAVVRLTPKSGEVRHVVLDHALAGIRRADIQGDGNPQVEVTIDYLEGYRGRLTLFMQQTAEGLRPIEYIDAGGGYSVQIELMDSPKGWWRRLPSGKGEEFLAVDARFDRGTDLMRIAWDGKRWVRTMTVVPNGSVDGAKAFPPREAFP
ncbi:MAG: hypothetical protein ACM33T_01025 [Solirubrobacterales bacterium]